MAYSEKMSDIIVLEKCEVDSTKKASIAFALNKGDNSVKSLQITSTFEIDLYLWCFTISKIWMKLLHPFKSYWSETTI